MLITTFPEQKNCKTQKTKKGVITMRFTADKLRIAKSAVALILAATVVLGSVFTVAAAIQSYGNNAEN